MSVEFGPKIIHGTYEEETPPLGFKNSVEFAEIRRIQW
jgi:hypothetical protein